MSRRERGSARVGGMALAVFAALGCGGGTDGGSGLIELDGSSTVFPISVAMAEEFQIANGRAVRVSVGVSGTGGGFQRFCGGETDISNASRPINANETEACARRGITPIEIQVAWDGLTVVAHPENDWVGCITVEELRSVWEPGSRLSRWSQIRPSWPDRELKLYGPDTDSGTFDYFTAAVLGLEGASRSDYTASAADHVLVAGVSGDPGALGYFGYAYFEENQDRLRALEVDGGAGCVAPSRQTILDGSYTPLARPMYLYVRRDALDRPEVGAFLGFYLDHAAALIPATGHIPLAPQAYAEMRARIADGGRPDSP